MATEFNPGQFLQGGLGFIGGLMDREAARSQANKNRDMQLMFAKKGIQMRVADAQKAGVHPLFALGGNVPSYSPVSMHTDMASMGQNLGRALSATQTVDERLSSAILRNWELRNKLLEKDVVSQPANPAVPYNTGTMQPVIAGQGDVVSAGSGWDEYPAVAVVRPPKADVDAGKHFGYTLIPNPKRFTMPKYMQDILGDEGIGQFIHTTGNYLDMLGRAFVRYHSPRFEARRRRWHNE